MSTLVDDLTGLYDQLSTNSHLLGLVQPRRFTAPQGYHPSRCIAGWLASSLITCRERFASGLLAETVEMSTYTVAYSLVKEGVPVYYVSEDLIRAVAATEPMEQFTIGELQWPRSAMVLGFPTAFMQEYAGVDLCYVGCAKIEAGDHKSPIYGGPTIAVPKSKVGVFYAFHDQGASPGVFNTQVSAYHYEDRLRDYWMDYAYHDQAGLPDERIPEAEERIQKVTSLVYKLLLILSVGGTMHLVEEGSCIRVKSEKKGRVKDALWSPNFIGAKYKIKSEPQGGTHASPRMHFRRGHLHTYWHGPGKTLSKLNWVEPVLVGKQ